MQTFTVFWLRETGCDAGVAMEAAQLDPNIRRRVLALAAGESGEFILRLPFMDKIEWRKRAEILTSVPLEREGRLIRAVLEPVPAARDLAATLVLTDPIWMNTPPEQDLDYFPAWQRVSVHLQRWLRNAIATAYFADVSRFADRPSCYTMIVYQCSRLYRGRPRTDFTYDLRDYPDCLDTLMSALQLTGRSVETVLEDIQGRLHEAGQDALARRYSPIWRHDILISTRRKPRLLAALLSAESMLIEAVIDLGTERSVATVNRLARTANRILRNVMGMDLRRLAAPSLEEATEALTHPPESSPQDLTAVGAFEDSDLWPARGPHLGVGGEEDGDYRRPCGRGQVGNAGVVADVDPRAGQPACQLV